MPLPPGESVDAFLFDMDGTILTSVRAAERVWRTWAKGHDLDVEAFLPTIHGVQAEETIRRLGLDGVDPAAEAKLILQGEIEDVAGIEAIAGAAALLATLPLHRWAIVTSSPRRLALRRLEAAGLPVPGVLIAAEDVEHGKPAPDCFLLAAKRLHVDIARCLAFEDSLAGFAAAEASGAVPVMITATHTKAWAGSHRSMCDYEGITVAAGRDGSLSVLSTGSNGPAVGDR